MSALAGLLREWMPHQRWFGGKGREWAGLEEESFFLDKSHPVLSIHRVTVSYSDGATDTYLVPLSWRDHPVDELSSAMVGAIPHQDSETYAYDAMRDRDATSVWLTHLAEGAMVGPLRFVPAEGADIPAGLPGDIISTEQSNTSLVYGQQAILKLFRRLEPGHNPDVEIHGALRQTENPHIAPLLGHAEIDGHREPGEQSSTVLMLQEFVPNASDGWRLATASVRDLFSEGDLHADEVGGDFAADSERLGAATASVHAAMAKVLATEPAPDDWFGTVARHMTERLEAAIQVVPQLADHAPGIRAIYETVAATSEPVVRQRVHGDRLDRARLRGRAGPPAGRPPAARQPTARRRRDAAQLRLRRPAHAGRAARRRPARLPRAGVGGAQPHGVLHRLLERQRPRSVRRLPAAACVRGRQGGVRVRLRGAQPPALADDPAALARPAGRARVDSRRAGQRPPRPARTDGPTHR